MTQRFDLTRLLHPRSIAVYGGGAAAAVVRGCLQMGFAGRIAPVHPDRAEIGGVACIRSLDELPEPPDVAFIGVNRRATIEVVAELARRGAGGATCYASGFREVGAEGDALQAALVAAAGAMPVLGPNCYGFINAFDRIAVWPDVHGLSPVETGVAVITQSSNIGINITMSRRGLPIGFMIALGNQAQVGLADAIRAVADDDRVTGIGLYVEGITDALTLAAAVAYANSRGKPVVMLKSGRSALGSAIAMTHTASLAGSAAVTSAFLKRIGVAEVRSIPVLIETLKLVHAGGPLSGAHIVSLSCSGGEASMMSDAAEGRAVHYSAFAAEAEAAIRATVDPLVTVSNPFDYHTFDWGKRDRLTQTFSAVMRAGQDLTVLVIDWPKAECGPAPDWDIAVAALTDAASATGARAAILSTLPECLPEAISTRLGGQGVAALAGIDDAMAAIEAAASLPPRTAARSADQAIAAPVALIAGRDVNLTEVEAKAALARFSLAVPDGRLVDDRASAIAAAEALGYPVVAKAVGAALTHKTELGAVALNLRDAATVGAAFDRLKQLGDGVLVEAMVTDAVAELILGVARDGLVGLHLVIGAGGVWAELLQDVAILCLPASRLEIEAALKSLRVAPLLHGFRGKPAGDIEAVTDAILGLARFAEAHADRLIDLDVNPLMVRPVGSGAVAVDALIRLREPAP